MCLLHADLSTWCWVFCAPYAGLSLDKYPKIQAWLEKIGERPAVMEGVDIPEPNMIKKAIEDPELMKKLVADAQSMMASTKL